MRTMFLILMLCVSSITHGAQITYSFTGILDGVIDDYGFINGEFSSGNTFSGSFTYLTATPEGSTTIGDTTTAIYSAVTNLSVNINGYIIDGNSSTGYLQVWDNRVVGSSIVDAFTVNSPLDFSPPISGMGPGNVVAAANIKLFDFTNTASQFGVSIPTIINLSDYGSPLFRAIQLNTDTNQSFQLTGTVTSLTAVPVPASVILFLSGLAALIGFNGKRLTISSTRPFIRRSASLHSV